MRKIVEEELLAEKEGKKDACYHKVKSRYKVWPSAYASGALVKCRKVGAKNWGNSKKENIDRDRIRELVEAELSKLDEKRKLTKKPSSETSLRDWFGRKGEKRAKYPKCRPTPSACEERGDYGKKSKAGKKG